jgi:hypothetical protein
MGLWHGAPGSGKTVAIGSMPGPILLFDFDGRIDPLIDFYPRRTDVEFYTVGLSDDSRHDTIGLMTFAKMMERLQSDCPYGTVAIDSYTMMSAVSVLYNMGHRDNKKLKRTGGGIPIPDWEEFKGETGIAIQVMEVAKIISANFIMTAHPVTKAQTKTQEGSASEILASMVKATTLQTYGWKTSSFLPCYFNEMYYFYSDTASDPSLGVRRWIQTIGAGEIVAKSALGLPAKVELTNKPLWNVIEALIAERKAKIDKIRSELKEDRESFWSAEDLPERYETGEHMLEKEKDSPAV